MADPLHCGDMGAAIVAACAVQPRPAFPGSGPLAIPAREPPGDCRVGPVMALRFIDPATPGYTRARQGEGWAYFGPHGRRITAPHIVARLDAIGLPPAYEDAWFARHADAHIQATGIDARGRKQYRYHPDYRAAREAEKFGQCAAFGRALPKIRGAVDRALRRGDLSRDRIIAAIIRLLDTGAIRVGNESYARANGSYGATTLRTRHARISGQRVELRYVGKSGKAHRLSIADARLARLVRRCADVPGQHLFRYLDADGTPQPVGSNDINAWLARFGPFTAKHFRTWRASVIALDQLLQSPRPSLAVMLAEVAARLGNTPAIARKSYVHPLLIDIARGDRPLPALRARATARHSREERLLLQLLESVTLDDEG